MKWVNNILSLLQNTQTKKKQTKESNMLVLVFQQCPPGTSVCSGASGSRTGCAAYNLFTILNVQIKKGAKKGGLQQIRKPLHCLFVTERNSLLCSS